ncbi:MAG TPA: hypothetical protein VFQ61_16220 [Polyangiaceae bacterium]|nr:hypothetical protein [Polyangiaceae bacterium]
MTRFDLARLRHNFDRCHPPEVPALPVRFARVREPRAVGPEARLLLAAIRRIVERDFSAQLTSLRPFLDETSALLDRLERAAAPTEGQPSPSVDPTPAENASELRQQLRVALQDVEDLLEVYSGMGRR